MKRRRKARRNRAYAIPEAIPLRGRNSMAPWELKHSTGTGLTNLHEHTMQADMRYGEECQCGADHGRGVRRHEMGHVNWTPLNWMEQARTWKAPLPMVQAVEDGRLNYRHHATDTVPDALVCPDDMDLMVAHSARGKKNPHTGVEEPPDFMGLAAMGAAAMGADDWTTFQASVEKAKLDEVPGWSRVENALRESRGFYEDKTHTATFEKHTKIIAEHLTKNAAMAQQQWEDALAAQREAERREAEREDLDEEDWVPGDEKGEGLDHLNELWGEMVVERPPLVRRMDFMDKRWKVREEGVVPTRPDRVLTDGKMFGYRVRGGGTTVLVDTSGSMSWNVEDLKNVLNVVPATTVALYSADFDENGVLRVVAENGKRCEDKWVRCPSEGGNGIDGKALRWARAQRARRTLWISDGGVTGLGDTAELYEDALKQCEKGVMRVDTVDECVAVLRGRKRYEPGWGSDYPF